MNEYTIVLADEQVLFRQGLKKILEETSGLKVVGETAGGTQLISLLEECEPHMVIVGMSAAKNGVVDAVAEIRMVSPHAKVLLLAMQKDKDCLYRAFRSGAHGYFLKEDSHEDLLLAIEKIQQNETYVSPHFLDALADSWKETDGGSGTRLLTSREKEILKLVANGGSSKAIAKLLYISSHTVDRHRANIMAKLRVKKSTDLVKYAIAEGLI